MKFRNNSTGKKAIMFSTKYRVKLYDFDRGSALHPAVQRNLDLDQQFCSYGQCNNISSRADLFSILVNAIDLVRKYDSVKNTYRTFYYFGEEIRKWIQSATSVDKLIEENKKYNRVYYHLLSNKIDITTTSFPYPSSFLNMLTTHTWSTTENFFNLTSDIGDAYTPPDYIDIPVRRPLTRTSTGSIPIVFSTAGFRVNAVVMASLPATISGITAKTETDGIFDKIIMQLDWLVFHVFLKEWVTEFKNFSYQTKGGTDIKVNYDYKQKAKQLWDSTLSKKLVGLTVLPSTNAVFIIIACYMLSLPQWHNLNKDVKTTILSLFFVQEIKDNSETLYRVMDDIWNLHSNELPIELPII